MTDFHDAAKAIAYALGEPPTRVNWAEAIVYADGEVRYFEDLDEDEAHERARASGLRAMTLDRMPRETDVVSAFAAYQEVRVLADGTQIISPWRVATTDAARVAND